MKAIQTEKLTKDFGSLRAVDNVTLSVEEGEIFGLLGPNGAGKTTLISMLVTMRKPTSGTATVNAHDIAKDPSGVRHSIGIVFQDQSLDEELTAYENLELHAALYSIPKKERDKRINEVMKTVGLYERLHDIVKTFSGGMRRRLEIARGLIHYPKVLFLDEPTLGLDPQTRTAIWEYISKIKKEHGITVVLTTHYMEEADSLCDRLAIIDHGKIIALDSPQALKDSLEGDTVTIETDETTKLKKIVEKNKLVECANIHNGKLSLCIHSGEKMIPKLIDLATKNKIEVKSVSLHKPTLDNVFLHYTGKTIREEEATVKDSMRIRMQAWGRRK
jgi:ABC-2 type transport system ATP-binding protein